MRRLIALAALLAAASPAAAADTIIATQGLVPAISVAFGAKGGAAKYVDTSQPLPTTDANGASYTFAPAVGSAEGSSAAAYTFSTSGAASARAFYAICTAASSFVPTGVNGGSLGAAFPLTAGLQYHPMRIASFTANGGTGSPSAPSGCCS